MRIYWPDPGTNELKCSWLDCAFGMGLAGAGRCPGLWFMVNCPAYETVEEFEESFNEQHKKPLRRKPQR